LLLGQVRSSTDYIFNNGGTARGMAIGTIGATPLSFGTNNTQQMQIASSGAVTISSTTTIGNSTTTFQVYTDGHVFQWGTTPTISSCGSSPSLVASSSDMVGTINVGSGVVTACTLNFQDVMQTGNASCIESDNSTAITGDISSISSSSVTFGFSATLGGGQIYYRCNPI
jgi:hypothetical protein